MEYIHKSLKELANQYSERDIIIEYYRRFLIANDAYISFLKLIKEIKNASEGTDPDRMFNFLIYETETEWDVYPAFEKNRRRYKLTDRNTRDINKLAGYMVPIRQDDSIEPIVSTDTSNGLQLLVLILLSINAFSKEAVDYYYDGDIKSVDYVDYLVLAKENRKNVKGKAKTFLDNISHWIS